MESTQEGIKQNVREHYTKAVTGGGSCCGCSSSSASIGDLQRGRVVAAAGYTAEELEALPKDAVVNSFGCGNPLAFAGVERGQLLVDIGSGAGIDCLLAAQKVGPEGRVIGIDMTPVMIEKARENARDAGVTNAEFRLGDAESMPVEDGAADWIISNCVINLSPDKPKVFAEAYRVLKPGGRLSISDIMVEADLPWALRHSAELYASCVAGAIPESQYVDEIRKAGFSDVQVTERIVYDRDMIMSLISDNRLLGTLAKLVQGPVETAIDRHVAGKIWSAKIVAKK
ncbi:MAG: arsenite methyltransferase [Acidobacteria bacterium]|nr:arsenite methyltransferase [Acidobacteriota bacterium]